MHMPSPIDPMRRVDGPALACDLPGAIHPHVEAARRHTERWTVELGLVDPRGRRFATMVAARFTDLAARSYAHVTAGQLELVSDFIAWLFFYDDLCDGAAFDASHDPALARLEQRLIEALHHGDVEGGDPLTRAAVDLHRRLATFVAPGWLDRIAGDMASYVAGVQWERALRSAGLSPALATYRQLRPLISAVPLCMAISAACRAPHSPALGAGPWARTLLQMANDHISWVNDVYSVERELHNGSASNLVMVLSRDHGMTIAAARDLAILECNAQVQAFVALADHARARMPEADLAYVELLAQWIRGNLDWHDESRRYRGDADLGDMALLRGAA